MPIRPFKEEVKRLVQPLRTYFVGRDEHIVPKSDDTYKLGTPTHKWDGRHITTQAQLLSATILPNRYGGGQLMHGFLGQGRQCFGQIASYFTETSVDATNYAVTSNGGPYVTLDGTNDYLSISDAAWQEVGANKFFVWSWCYLTDASTSSLLSKYDQNGDQCSWRLHFNTSVFIFSVNGTGPSGSNVTATSTASFSTDTWYFVAGYYQPSTLVRVYVAPATATSLTTDSNTTSVPASLFNTTAVFTLGSGWNGASLLAPLTGRLGANAAWKNTSETSINDFATEVFYQTRFFYS